MEFNLKTAIKHNEFLLSILPSGCRAANIKIAGTIWYGFQAGLYDYYSRPLLKFTVAAK